jgi:hypothetical protein
MSAFPSNPGRSLAIPGESGAGYIATLLPVQRGQRCHIVAPFAASAAIFMQDPLEARMMPGEAFARPYAAHVRENPYAAAGRPAAPVAELHAGGSRAATA